MSNFEIENEKPVIIIEEKPEIIPGQGKGEVPTIIVERDNRNISHPNGKKPFRRLPWILGSAFLTGLLCVFVWLAWRYYRTYINIGVPVSVTSEQNIAILQTPGVEDVIPEVIKSADSILGVAMNFYDLRGLKAEISMQEPDTTDTSVYLYSRCSDYHPDFSIIGDLVINGQEMKSVDGHRIGYFAGADNKYVIGIARDKKVKDYVMERGGCFFRQFILLSAGVLPPKYYLHGKVERRGIGRKYDGSLYYIETLNKETMWDFADALRECGFEDAIYITGGKDYCFYRTADGERHDISDPAIYPHKNPGQIPWLIFRKRKSF